MQRLRRALEPVIRRIMHFYWRFSRGATLGARAMVIDGAGRIFLIKHSYVDGWHLPGGGVETGETLLEALARELAEEGNIELGAAPQLYGVYFNKRVVAARPCRAVHRPRLPRRTEIRSPITRSSHTGSSRPRLCRKTSAVPRAPVSRKCLAGRRSANCGEPAIMGRVARREANDAGQEIGCLPPCVRQRRPQAKAGEALFRLGDKTAGLCEVICGRVRLARVDRSGHEIVLHVAGPGETIAEASLFSPQYHCDAIASTKRYGADLSEGARCSPHSRRIRKAAQAFSATLARQVMNLRTRIEQRNIRSARERVRHYLALNAGADGRTVELRGTLKDIAAELGLTTRRCTARWPRSNAQARSGAIAKKSR